MSKSSSLLSSLTNLLEYQTTSSMAAEIGESESSVLRTLRPLYATILGGIVNKVNDLGGLQEIYELITDGTPQSAHSIDTGRRLLTMIFGGNQAAVAAAVGQDSGIRSEAVEQLMPLAAPVVLSVLEKRIRSENISFAGFADLLRSENAEIRRYLPVGLSSLWNSFRDPDGRPPKPSNRTIPVLVLAALLLSIFWYLQRGRSEVGNAATDTGSQTRARLAIAGLGEFSDRQLPGNVRLSVPVNGVEARLLSFLQDPERTAGSSLWFDFDRLTFDTASAIPNPESEEQLQNIAVILKAYPNVRLKIGGYTDNSGNRNANMRLSENRAQAVKRELIAMGADGSRLEAEGYGDRHPIADNKTEEGRAKNRRISMRVLQK